MDLLELWEAWQWRYSRSAEVTIMAAAVIGNRIPMNEEAVDVIGILRYLPLYKES